MALNSKPERRTDRDEKVSATKLHATQYVVVIVLAILATGMWRLQILGVTNYRLLADANRVRKIPVVAPRGKIFDREGRILVDNYPSVSCYLLREQAKSLDADVPMIARGLDLPVEQVQPSSAATPPSPSTSPSPSSRTSPPTSRPSSRPIATSCPSSKPSTSSAASTPATASPPTSSATSARSPKKTSTAPSSTSTSPATWSANSASRRPTTPSSAAPTDRAMSSSTATAARSASSARPLAIPGQDLRLTIDLDLQRVAEQAMEGRNGAIVAMDPHTGEILAMVSRPTFDPNQFAVRLTKAYWSQVSSDPDHPMMNKAIQAQYAPGSTFKIIMSLAGLEEGVAQGMHVMCSGGATFYGRFFACDHAHGMVDIDHAIPWSCDTYYYTLAEKLGIDTIAKYATEVGLSQKTGVDLPDEATGTMPSTAWKLKTQHEKWYAGETISVGIGQGAVQATPLQLARALSGIASGGVLKRPHVVFPDELPSGMASAIDATYPGSGDSTIPIAPDNWETITDAMAQTMLPGGFDTGAAVRLEGIDFAGKTGTAQVVNHSVDGNNLLTGNARANAWFVGMVPRRNPDIVVAVLCEHGGWGAEAAAPLAAQVINAFVSKQRRREGNLIAVAPKPAPAPTPAPTPPANGTPTALVATEPKPGSAGTAVVNRP